MAKLTQEELDFMKWLDSPEQAVYWITNDKGEKVLMREGWGIAEKEYMRIKQTWESILPPVKYQRKLDVCQLIPGNE